MIEIRPDRELEHLPIAQLLGDVQIHACEQAAHMYVAELDGVPVGYIGLNPDDHRVSGGVWIDAMGVHPDHQGEGIGKAMLAFATALSATGETGGDVETGNTSARSFFHSLHEGVETDYGQALPLPDTAGNSQVVVVDAERNSVILRGKPKA